MILEEKARGVHIKQRMEKTAQNCYKGGERVLRQLYVRPVGHITLPVKIRPNGDDGAVRPQTYGVRTACGDRLSIGKISPEFKTALPRRPGGRPNAVIRKVYLCDIYGKRTSRGVRQLNGRLLAELFISADIQVQILMIRFLTQRFLHRII